MLEIKINYVIYFSPPTLTVSPRQYKDEDGVVQEESPYDGNPSYKRKFLETHRPIDWWPEWIKTPNMMEIAKDPKLKRGCRIRFFNGVPEDIMPEEVSLIIFLHIQCFQYQRILESSVLQK